MHENTYTNIMACITICTCIQPYESTHTKACTHIFIHTQAYTHTHTHTLGWRPSNVHQSRRCPRDGVRIQRPQHTEGELPKRAGRREGQIAPSFPAFQAYGCKRKAENLWKAETMFTLYGRYTSH